MVVAILFTLLALAGALLCTIISQAVRKDVEDGKTGFATKKLNSLRSMATISVIVVLVGLGMYVLVGCRCKVKSAGGKTEVHSAVNSLVVMLMLLAAALLGIVLYHESSIRCQIEKGDLSEAKDILGRQFIVGLVVTIVLAVGLVGSFLFRGHKKTIKKASRPSARRAPSPAPFVPTSPAREAVAP